MKFILFPWEEVFHISKDTGSADCGKWDAMKEQKAARLPERHCRERAPGMKKQSGCYMNRSHRSRGFAAVCFFLVCVMIVSGCGRADGPATPETDGQEKQSEYSLNDFYFDTVISIKFDAKEDGDRLVDGCRSICDEIQTTFSRTDENSELYLVNHRDTDRVEVSEALAELVQVGLDYYEISKGRFDITIAPLSDLWDFKSENPSVPSEAEIQSALRKVDASAVHVEREETPQRAESGQKQTVQTGTKGTKTDLYGVQTETEAAIETETEADIETETEAAMETETEAAIETEIDNPVSVAASEETEPGKEKKAESSLPPAADEESEQAEETESEGQTIEQERWFIRFDSEDTMIDLGALVKGYAADRLAEYLRENGVSSGLINLGGNVYALGPKADGSAWTVGIQKPFETGVIDTVEVTDQSVVSSGVYERCFEKDGVLYHHILDPKTGYPVSNNLWGVSVISDSSLTGDALSTTCLAIGLQEAQDLIRSTDNVSAIFVDDSLHVVEVE